jgi:hypothetical protein
VVAGKDWKPGVSLPPSRRDHKLLNACSLDGWAVLSCLPRAEVGGPGPDGVAALLKDLTTALNRLGVGTGGSGAAPPPVIYLDEV